MVGLAAAQTYNIKETITDPDIPYPSGGSLQTLVQTVGVSVGKLKLSQDHRVRNLCSHLYASCAYLEIAFHVAFFGKYETLE